MRITAFLILAFVLISSCTLIKPKEQPMHPPELRQWATSASASSSYGGKYGQQRDDNSAFAATGEPDVKECGDSPKAWVSKEEDNGEQWLELSYYDEIYVSKVRIMESSVAGAVRKIELKDEETYYTLWEGQYKTKQCPFVFEKGYSLKEGNITINMTPFKTDTVKITLDTDVAGWNEIDAVELAGYAARWYYFNSTLGI